MLILNVASMTVTTSSQWRMPINMQYYTYSKLMFKDSLPKISPCSLFSCGWP